MTTRYPMWPPAVVEGICDVLGRTDRPGLTGREIDRLLGMLGIADVQPGASKRDRLWAALMSKQQANQASNCIIRFITEAMAPGRYLEDPARFEALRDGLAEPLALVGCRVSDTGRVAPARRATTLDEVAALAGRLRTELTRRGVHPEVTRYCEEEILRKSLFHAVFEATKGLAERLRQLGGSQLDGADLVDYCFAVNTGSLRINGFRTETEISEHKGFANLLKGVFGTFRNPPAHTPRAAAGWTITEPDALDLFSTLSLLHRRLDSATRVSRP
ncbi:TIGR02391 family protein [Frankia sp. Cr1]|uniref:TIGR02391 family protein n=1 Tax=Frankia sp. Cr1 TaxID=3073931 RepID=UPI002AD4B035|nr:TIGR02391 family protein [Frankia sp. Cr1]